MNENDFERIGQLVAQIVDSRLERIDARFEQMEARLELADAKVETFKSEIIAEFNHSLDIKFEALRHELRLYGDGLADVTERVDRLEDRVNGIDEKIEKVSL